MTEQLKLSFLQDFIKLEERIEEDTMHDLQSRCFSTDLIAGAPRKEEPVTEHDLIGIYWRCYQYLASFSSEAISPESLKLLKTCIGRFSKGFSVGLTVL
jgi:hypothetical protein